MAALLQKLGLVLVYSLSCLFTVARSRSKRAIADISAAGASQGRMQSFLGARAKGPMSSSWFGDFSWGESSYTDEGVDASKEYPGHDVAHGKDPSVSTGFENDEVLGHEFFHESDSGGAAGDWQTHFPGAVLNDVGTTIGGKVAYSLSSFDRKANEWRYTPSGWIQEYKEPVLRQEIGGKHLAAWFDNSVKQLDQLGRQSMPTAGTARSYLNGWAERSVNTSITCTSPGCKGSSSLQLFDAATEEGKLCSVSIFVHPTDYDDDWSTEHVEYWKVNGAIAAKQCNPRARGCNSTAEKPLYTCVNALNVDDLVNSAGAVVLEGKNTAMVDDCPEDGNLLSAIAIGTCMFCISLFFCSSLFQKPSIASEARACCKRIDLTTTTTTTLFSLEALHTKGVLKCDTPGCQADTKLHFVPAVALNGGTCSMSVNVTQTDYDDSPGEAVTFFAVEGKNMTTAPVTPGKNPCMSAFQGTNLTAADRVFQAVTKFDVTDLVKTTHPLGILDVSGKITPMVDECGYKGNLLYAEVSLDCIPKK